MTEVESYKKEQRHTNIKNGSSLTKKIGLILLHKLSLPRLLRLISHLELIFFTILGSFNFTLVLS